MGLGVVEVFMRSNILALVGGGPMPRFPRNKVIVWDDYQNKCIAELEFTSAVLGVRLRRERIVVALEFSVYVYNFVDLSFVAQVPTFANPTGQLGLCVASPITMVYPAVAQGHLAIRCEDPADPTGVKCVPRPTLATHNGPLACVALSLDGKLAATASDKGTLVRVWDTTTGAQVKEFRRGSENAHIWSMCFSQDNALLAVSSSKGTCHIFALQDGLAANKQSSLHSLRGMLPAYFSSEWSSLQVPVPSQRTTLSFAADKSYLLVLCHDGTCARINLDFGSSPSATLDQTFGWYNLLQ